MAQSSSPVEDVEQDKKALAAAEKEQHPRPSERRYRFGPHRHRWLSWPRWWREALLVLLLVTAVLCLINPFPKMAFARATAAGPAEPLPVSPPIAPENGYCLAGDFQGWDGRNTPLFDDGTEGNQTAGDGLFARTITFAEPGRYLWRVLPCGDWTQAVPDRAAWFFVTTPDQPITFTFRAADVESRFWPNTYALTANDTLPARLVAVGTFQNEPWNNKDNLTELQPLNSDQFQLAYRVPQPGTYQAYVSVQGRDERVGANGRSMEATPLEFTTRVASEWVLFQYDGRSSRIAVLYQIPWWLGWLGFEHGAQIVAALAMVGVLVLAIQVINLRFVNRPDWQSSAGCPTCQGELRRVNRTTTDYLLGLVGIPVRRYKCRQCGWQGRRIHRHH